MHIYIDADYKKDDFLRLRLYCTRAGTHLPCQLMFTTYFQQMLLKSPCVPVWMLFLILALYWDTSKDVWQCKNLGFCFTQCKLMEFCRQCWVLQHNTFNYSPISWPRKSNVHRFNSCSDVYHHHSWSSY